MSAFKGEEKIEMNRIATVPPTINLGDILDQVGFGNPDYVNPSSKVFLYVETPANGGDDLNDGTSKQTAFASPLRALNEIPRNSTGEFEIQCGKGAFFAPVIKDGWPLATIKVYADRSSPVLTFPAGTNMSKTVNAHTRFELIGAGAHGGFTDHDHWIEGDVDAGSFAEGYTVEQSVSPDIHTVSGFSLIKNIIAVHKRDTVFISPSADDGKFGIVNGISSDNQPVFIGIDFDFSNQNLSSFPFISPRFIKMVGCRCGQYTTGPNGTDLWSCMLNEGFFVGSESDSYRPPSGCIVNQFGIIERNIRGGNFRGVIKGPNVGSFNRYQISRGSESFGFIMDFDVTSGAPGFPAVEISDGAVIGTANGPYLNGSYSTAFLIKNQSSINFASPMRGSVAGVCIDVKNGSSVGGLGIGHTVVNSVTPGDEVVVGSNAPTTFALAVGTNDYTAVASEGCRGN